MFTNLIFSLGYLSAFDLKKYLSPMRQCGYLSNSSYQIVSLEENILLFIFTCASDFFNYISFCIILHVQRKKSQIDSAYR